MLQHCSVCECNIGGYFILSMEPSNVNLPIAGCTSQQHRYSRAPAKFWILHLPQSHLKNLCESHLVDVFGKFMKCKNFYLFNNHIERIFAAWLRSYCCFREALECGFRPWPLMLESFVVSKL